MSRRSLPPTVQHPSGPLKHTPFAGLAASVKPSEGPGAPGRPGSQPEARKDYAQSRQSDVPPQHQAACRSAQSEPDEIPARPHRPFSFTLRRETKGRAGKTVTRVLGIPPAQIESLMAQLKRALGCGAVVEGSDLVLLGDLEERASKWLRNASNMARAPQQGSPLAERERSDANNAGTQRHQIRAGQRVAIVLKADQSTGVLTEGVVRDILTNSNTHPHGIKVRLESGLVGRVKKLFE